MFSAVSIKLRATLFLSGKELQLSSPDYLGFLGYATSSRVCQLVCTKQLKLQHLVMGLLSRTGLHTLFMGGKRFWCLWGWPIANSGPVWLKSSEAYTAAVRFMWGGFCSFRHTMRVWTILFSCIMQFVCCNIVISLCQCLAFVVFSSLSPNFWSVLEWISISIFTIFSTYPINHHDDDDGWGEEWNPKKQYFLTLESFLNDGLALLKIKSNELHQAGLWNKWPAMWCEQAFGPSDNHEICHINYNHLNVHLGGSTIGKCRQ